MSQLTYNIDIDAPTILFGINEGEVVEGVSVYVDKFLVPQGIYWWYHVTDIIMTAVCKEYIEIYENSGDVLKIPHIRTEEQYFQQSLIYDLPYTFETALVLLEIADKLHLVLHKDYP